MHCYPTVVTLDYFISIFAIVPKTNTANHNMVHFLGGPVLRLLKNQRVLLLKNKSALVILERTLTHTLICICKLMFTMWIYLLTFSLNVLHSYLC